MNFWNQHLTTKVASSFLILSLFTVGVVGSVAFFKAREALKTAAFNQLRVTATLKEGEITRWFEDQQRDFLLVTQFPDVQANVKVLLNGPTTDQKYKISHNILSEYLKNVVKLKPNFKEIFIIDRTNKVILSTKKRRENEYEILASITYIETVEPGGSFDPIFYVSADTNKPSVTLAAPLRDGNGTRQGVILAHLNLERIDQIVRERKGLGKSGETYLVGSLITQNTFISKEDSNTQEYPEGVSSKGIDDAMSGISGEDLYNNYAKVPVIGVYHWLNDQDLALIIEMHQEEAFLPARQLAGTIVLVGLVSVGFLLIGVYWLTRQLKISRQQLENYSRKLEQKAHEAEAANRAKSEFLANMSHELRTPLNTILGFTQLLTRDPCFQASQLEQLEIISRSGEHLLTLINDVLSMAKIEAGRTTLNENSFDLYAMLDSLEEMFRQKAESKGLKLICDRYPEVPRYVQTDESKLRQVLINLIGNAIKFTEEGGVAVRVKMGNGQTNQLTPQAGTNLPQKVPKTCKLDFEVEDTGSGIAPSEMERLFKPFVQTETGRKSQQGTGLGLTISQQFVHLMGGDITVSSTLGHGTIFSFDVEIAPMERLETQTQQKRRRVLGVAPNQPKYRILIVEDKWENRHLLFQMLTSLGFEVRGAENGLEGVHLWETWEPHLILMDMRMPVMDGYEATKRIKAHLKGQATTIIALTASAFDEERTVVLSAGCDDFVRKPFREEVILEKMTEFLGVRFVYDVKDEVESRKNETTPSSFTLEASSLGVMPPEWVTQLHQAALCTDEKQIFNLIEQIPEEYATLANALIDLVENFRIDKIIDLTQAP
ncbi:response regulator [Scytonema sp. UIC 10036]|uniref:hybrid sensor histidine kinase/response regulator n=1 Tax=Scytonema sp. UIC 10036 TaxID=2304196 RepID=UPI0012DAD08A|nr:response regulator [Scytonema sp. UIC 10036]MUG94346.1 response regulator [Scytonema sp. UIC 10036]